MISILAYIHESLKTDIQKWLKDIYQTQQSLIKDNKLQPIQVDTSKLNKPKKSFIFDEYATDETFKKIINNKQVGFTVASQMLRIPNQYLKDDDKEYKPDCIPYWYKDDKNVYFVGLCMYDKNVTYIDSFIHLINIESSLIVSESLPLLKAMLNDFIKTIDKEGNYNLEKTKLAHLYYRYIYSMVLMPYDYKKEGNYNGISAKPTHPKIKATLIKLGFNASNDNKNILTYKI